MTQTLTCASCGMPIDSGQYCQHCTDADGNLQDFTTRFESMVSWQREREPDASEEELAAQTRAKMATLPAWRNHSGLAQPTDGASGGAW